MPRVNQQLGLVVAGLGGIAQRFRHVAIHHAFAGDEPKVALQRFLKQRIDGVRVDRVTNARRGRAVADQFVAEDARDSAGVRLFSKGLLRGIDVVGDPVRLARQAPAGPCSPDRRGMDRR